MYQNPEPKDEVLECFDEHGNIIEPHTRQELHMEPLKYWHGVVNVWLVNPAGQLLCSKRSATLNGNPGKWQTYFGGHVKAGKSFRQAAVLELDEEVGLRINKKILGLIEKGRYEPAKHFYESYAYPFNGDIADLKFNDGEITEVKFMDMDEYWRARQTRPEDWCNSCNPDQQEKIRRYASDMKN